MVFKKMYKKDEKIQLVLFLIFVASSVATLGSLFFSLVLNLPPCELCWYQRICMYPIMIISMVGLARKETTSFYYILPLALIGLGFAFYHNLLYYGVIENIVPCAQGVSCTSRQLQWFGFLTIPLMSLGGFLILLGLFLRFYFLNTKAHHEK